MVCVSLFVRSSKFFLVSIDYKRPQLITSSIFIQQFNFRFSRNLVFSWEL